MMVVTPGEQLDWILERVPRLPSTRCELADATGATLAADARARHDLPLWNNSAMDGYAVRAADLEGASAAAPAVLAVIGEVPAGSPSDPKLSPGTAVRIMTGAPVPGDADTVVPVEKTESDRDGEAWAKAAVRVLETVPIGANVRLQGEDTSRGTVVAAAGGPLTAARVAALAAAGMRRVEVRRAPRVAVLTTGSELRAPGEPLARGQIPESNSWLLAGLLRESGIEPVEVLRGADDAVSLRRRVDALSEQCDAIITTGGVGPGTHDAMRMILAEEPEVRAVRVAVRPGQPQCAGRLRGGAFVFALPGNPVSAAVSFELFVRPALLSMQGRARLHRVRVLARAEAAWRGARGRLQVLPVRVTERTDGLRCSPAVNPRGVSHAVGGHGGTDGYAFVEAERGDVSEGETVSVALVVP